MCSCRIVLVRFDVMLVGSDTDGYDSRLESVALTPKCFSFENLYQNLTLLMAFSSGFLLPFRKMQFWNSHNCDEILE